MLEYARPRCPTAILKHGFAETADYGAVLGCPPDRVLFAYCLSMIADADGALRNARRQLAAEGEVVVVDFADLEALPALPARGLRRWLRAFHVAPVDADLLRAHGAVMEWGPGRYYLIARMGPLTV